MKDAEIIEALFSKMTLPVGRHLYGILGTYARLKDFSDKLQQVTTPHGAKFPQDTSINKGILDSIPDKEFQRLCQNEAKKPEPTAAHIRKAFEEFLRSILQANQIVVFSNFEMLFVYNIEFSLLRGLAKDENHVILLLPGRRTSGKIIMFHEVEDNTYTLPANLIAFDHLWELR